MAIVSYLPSNQITQINGFNYIAELQYGSDGQIWGPPEVDAGTASSRATGWAVWDDNPDDGVDSGWINTGYELKSGVNGLSLTTAASAGPVKYSVGTIGIGSIAIRAGVQNQAAMLWTSTIVQFYRGNTLQETVALNDFGVDKTQSWGIGQELVTIQPARTDNDRVEINGASRMVAPEGVYLDSYDTFSQIFAFGPGRGASGSSMSGNSLLTQTKSSFTDWKPLSTTSTPVSAPFSDELLGVEQVPDMLQSPDPGLL